MKTVKKCSDPNGSRNSTFAFKFQLLYKSKCIQITKDAWIIPSIMVFEHDIFHNNIEKQISIMIIWFSFNF